MPATPAWLASAEALLNRCIEDSAEAASLARRLEGTALQVDVTGITSIRASTHRGRLALLAGEPSRGAAAPGAASSSDSSPADASIRGSPAALLHLFRGGAGRTLANSAAQVRGDAEIADLYRRLLVAARPDPEEELSRWIGDFPARRLAELAEGVMRFARRARRTAGENIAEYLQEESRDLVNRTELDEFLRAVDELRETADRIHARLGHLEARLKGVA